LVLARCHQLLKADGILRVIVPDLEGLARRYVTKLDRDGDFGKEFAASPDRNVGRENAISPADEFCQSGVFFRTYRPPRSFFYDLYQRVFDYHSHFWISDPRAVSAPFYTAP